MPAAIRNFSFSRVIPPFSAVLRVSLTGPESTGKSTLAAQLAAHYGTTFAPEFAREYLADSGPHYSPKDLEEIARG
jgi:nicotinamide riboside kinase